MWFKNITLFDLVEPFTLTPEELARSFDDLQFRPCGGLEPFSFGWAPAMGRLGGELTHAAGGFIAMCARREDRLLPPAVIRETVEERIAQIESDDFRTVTRKERTRLRDDVTFELLPRAFTRSTFVHAYLSPADGLLVIDSTSPKGVEEFTILLGRAMGRIDLTPFETGRDIVPILTRWVSSNRTPGGFALMNECEMRDKADEKAIVRCVGKDLGSQEVRAHIDAGMEVQRLALSFHDRLSFVLSADLTLRRLRFESVREMEHDETLDAAGQFDMDFAYMTNELQHLVAELREVFPRS
ncbi:MAG: recombination-associated protein RdgC [Pseudomonadota bacterium]